MTAYDIGYALGASMSMEKTAFFGDLFGKIKSNIENPRYGPPDITKFFSGIRENLRNPDWSATDITRLWKKPETQQSWQLPQAPSSSFQGGAATFGMPQMGASYGWGMPQTGMYQMGMPQMGAYQLPQMNIPQINPQQLQMIMQLMQLSRMGQFGQAY